MGIRQVLSAKAPHLVTNLVLFSCSLDRIYPKWHRICRKSRQNGSQIGPMWLSRLGARTVTTKSCYPGDPRPPLFLQFGPNLSKMAPNWSKKSTKREPNWTHVVVTARGPHGDNQKLLSGRPKAPKLEPIWGRVALFWSQLVPNSLFSCSSA